MQINLIFLYINDRTLSIFISNDDGHLRFLTSVTSLFMVSTHHFNNTSPILSASAETPRAVYVILGF
jgi:hypothetical protein